MTVYFDPARGKWRYDFWRSHVRHTGYCLDENGRDCTSERAAAEAESVEKRRLKIAPKMARASDFTLAQAFAALKPGWKLQAHWPNRQRYIKELLGFFGEDVRRDEIDAAKVAAYVVHAQTRKRLLWTGGPKRDPSDPMNAPFWREGTTLRGPNTANLYLGTLRQALELKITDERTGRPALITAPKVPELAVPKRKARPVPDAIAIELRALLPPHVIEAMTVTLLFGFRRGEAFPLEISNVDFDARGVRLFAEDVKDNEDTFLPGSPLAMRYLRHLVDQAHARDTKHLITWRRTRKDPRDQALEAWRPLKRPRSSWARAMAIIEAKHGRRWRWHDIRAAFITQVALTSGGIAAQSLARHSDYETTQAYIEVADEFRRTAAERASVRPALKLIGGGKSPTPKSHMAKHPRAAKIKRPL